MGSSSKRKGYQYEREIVKAFESAGMNATRAWGSNGKALGLHECVDVRVDIGDEHLYIQAKRRKSISSYIKPDDTVHMQVIREDRGDSYAVVKLETLIDLIKNGATKLNSTAKASSRNARSQVHSKGEQAWDEI